MSETPTPAPTTDTPNEGADNDFEPITSRDALQKIIDKRLGRIKQQYSDYDDLRAKAAEFDKLQEQSKSEIQKLADRVAATENELKAERLNTLKATVASAKGVPAKWLHGDTVEELEASADEWLADVASRAKPTKAPAPMGRSGATNSDNRMDPKEKAAAALRNRSF